MDNYSSLCSTPPPELETVNVGEEIIEFYSLPPENIVNVGYRTKYDDFFEFSSDKSESTIDSTGYKIKETETCITNLVTRLASRRRTDPVKIYNSLSRLMTHGDEMTIKTYAKDCFYICQKTIMKYGNDDAMVKLCLCLLVDTFPFYKMHPKLLITTTLRAMSIHASSKDVHKLASILLEYTMHKFGANQEIFTCFCKEGGVMILLESFHYFDYSHAENTVVFMAKTAKSYINQVADKEKLSEGLMYLHARLVLHRLSGVII